MTADTSKTKIGFCRDRKFDIQLSEALIHERRLGAIFENGKIEKIELKTETWQWEKTGNICIEYRQKGLRPALPPRKLIFGFTN